MKKMKKKTRNIILLSTGVVLAGALAFAAQPIYQAINNNKKLPMPVKAEVDHELAQNPVSSYMDSNPVSDTVELFDDAVLDIDYSTIFETNVEPVAPPEEDPVNPKDVPEEVVPEAPEEEDEPEESEEANTVVRNQNAIASTIIGVAALIFTFGLAVLIARIIVKRHKKTKEDIDNISC